MTKACLIVPYFGKLPEWFDLYLDSCRRNSQYTWLLYTDDMRNMSYPENVIVKYISFDEFVDFIQTRFNFDICLDSPYKLCDYKPAYGYIFSEIIEGYDYWGYCDVDLIWGNIDQIFEIDEIEKFDKIGHLGHFSIIKNSKELVTIFENAVSINSAYQKVYTSPSNFIFDEWNEVNYNNLLLEHNKRILYLSNYSDIYPFNSFLQEVEVLPISGSEHKKKIILYAKLENRILTTVDIWGKQTERFYIHFQKRKMHVKASGKIFTEIYVSSDALTDKKPKSLVGLYLRLIINIFINVKFWKRKLYEIRYYIARRTHSLRKGLK